MSALKEITSKTDKYSVNLSSKTYVFEDKLTKHLSVLLVVKPYTTHKINCNNIFFAEKNVRNFRTAKVHYYFSEQYYYNKLLQKQKKKKKKKKNEIKNGSFCV